MAGPPSFILRLLVMVSVLGPGPIQGATRKPAKPAGPTRPVPFGFGSKATGGGSAAPQTPKDPAELQAWLADSVPRVILIDKTYDFTSPAKITAQGCQPWKPCSNGMKVQLAKNDNNWCTIDQNSPANILVSLDPSPLTPLMIASRKTLLGVGKSAIIKGKGITLYNVENIIIQNIHITWLNPHLVWGGDGLTIKAAKNIWIDHCTFSNIGREMIVSDGQLPGQANTGITISNNLISGKTEWLARCHNHHYWAIFFAGANDEITMANKFVYFSQTYVPKYPLNKRLPWIKLIISPAALILPQEGVQKQVVLGIPRCFYISKGATFEVGSGSTVLAEGNVFQNNKFQGHHDYITHDGGQSFVPFNPQVAKKCISILGRPCVTNLMIKSSPYKFSLDTKALAVCKAYPVVTKANVLPASSIQGGVPGGCGIYFVHCKKLVAHCRECLLNVPATVRGSSKRFMHYKLGNAFGYPEPAGATHPPRTRQAVPDAVSGNPPKAPEFARGLGPQAARTGNQEILDSPNGQYRRHHWLSGTGPTQSNRKEGFLPPSNHFALRRVPAKSTLGTRQAVPGVGFG
ncbi:hypothetical protein PTTG_09357 [Puccinia triticina 1-1 BBBD Race 1]|uniref:pectin lyase n=1 Tax=Puccinia triticina (isolate 1-1 / race 1 (BBBD)) TaxID=630390 RepID=A0A180GCI3_PUCT1|nr:hypothetical protein PTTG_09357 [Puccinia triticina 1-1 BBBD Race 1]